MFRVNVMVYGLICFDKSTAAINGNTVQTKLSNKIPFKEALSNMKNSALRFPVKIINILNPINAALSS